MARDVLVKRRAWERFLKRADQKTVERVKVERVKVALRLLKEFPRPTGLDIKPLRGTEVRTPDGKTARAWRLRLGSWRVLFYYDPGKDLVLVFRIERRERAYKGL